MPQSIWSLVTQNKFTQETCTGKNKQKLKSAAWRKQRLLLTENQTPHLSWLSRAKLQSNQSL